MSNNRSEVVDKSGKIHKLTRKQQAFADELLADKKISASEAVRRTYNVRTTGSSARTVASGLLANTNVQAYLDKHVSMAKSRVVELASQDEDKRLSFDASRDILDRTLGKAVQRVVSENSNVNVVVTLK